MKVLGEAGTKVLVDKIKRAKSIVIDLEHKITSLYGGESTDITFSTDEHEMILRGQPLFVYYQSTFPGIVTIHSNGTISRIEIDMYISTLNEECRVSILFSNPVESLKGNTIKYNIALGDIKPYSDFILSGVETSEISAYEVSAWYNTISANLTTLSLDDDEETE